MESYNGSYRYYGSNKEDFYHVYQWNAPRRTWDKLQKCSMRTHMPMSQILRWLVNNCLEAFEAWTEEEQA